MEPEVKSTKNNSLNSSLICKNFKTKEEYMIWESEITVIVKRLELC